MIDFPQFYLHFDTKNSLTLKVDRDSNVDSVFVKAIPLDATISQRLLSGEINETDLVVNSFAAEPYVLDKTTFPPGIEFLFIFDLNTFEINQLIPEHKLKEVLHGNPNLIPVKISEVIAYSILNSETTFSDWKIQKNSNGEYEAVFFKPIEGSLFFKNRIDFLSLVEVNLFSEKLKELEAFAAKPLCNLVIDFSVNKIKIECLDSGDDEFFKDFFIAITKKNDPSYLIKKVNLKKNSKFSVSIKGFRLKDLSIFSSAFHLRNSKIETIGVSFGEVVVDFNQKYVKISNSLQVPKGTHVSLIFRNKYDRTQVYRHVKLTEDKSSLIWLSKIPNENLTVDLVGLSDSHLKVKGV